MDLNAGEAEVGEFNMALFGEEHVVGFDVPVDYAVAVEVLEGEANFSDVERRHVFVEEAVHAEEALEVAPDHVVHHEVNR